MYYEDNSDWEYYDLDGDPAEQHNLAPEQNNQRLQKLVQQRQSEIEAMASTGQQQNDRPDIVEDRLEDLGYKM